MIVPVLIAALSFAQADMQSAQGAPPPNLVARKLNVDLSKLAVIPDSQRDLVRSIGRDVVCLCGTCPKEPMTDCRCGWAGTNMDTIEHLISRGMSRDAIKNAYREAYGEKVLAMVPEDGFAQTAWILPYTAIGLGLLAVIAFALRYRKRVQEKTTDLPPALQGRQDAQQDLARELEDLE